MTTTTPTITILLPDIYIGKGAVENNVGSITKKLGAKKVLIVTDRGVVQAGLVDKVQQPLEKEDIEFGVFDECEPDGPINIIKSCAKITKQGGYDLMISIGGGSTLDIGKFASVLATADDIEKEDLNQYFAKGAPRRGLPRIQIATTAGTGSELSRGSIVTDADGVKRIAFMGPWAHAEAVIVDPLLTLNLPQRITADTGMDALSHAIEGYTHPNSNVLSDMFNEMVIKLVADNLRAAYYKGSANERARYNMALAACFSLTGASMGAPLSLLHALAHALQMEAHCNHGTSISIMMPYFMEFNMMTETARHTRVGELMGEKIEGLSLRAAAQKGADAVRQLATDIDMPIRLRDIGIKKEAFPGFVDLLFADRGDLLSNLVYVNNNPRTCSREEAMKIYEAAW